MIGMDTVRYLLIGAFAAGPLGGVALTIVLAVTSALLAAMIGLAGGIALAMTRGIVHPAQIFLIVGLVYLLLCGALQWSASRLLRRHVGVPQRGAQPQNIGHPHAVRK
jgi:hypothetical protein